MSLRILNIQTLRSKKQTRRTYLENFWSAKHAQRLGALCLSHPQAFPTSFSPREQTSRLHLSFFFSFFDHFNPPPSFSLSSHNLGQVLRWSQDFFILNICDCKFRYRSNSQNGSSTWSYPRRHCIYPLPLPRFFGKFLVFGLECCSELNTFPRFRICSFPKKIFIVNVEL